MGRPMTQFMEKSVNNADKVLLIMTPNYKNKADNRLGGVGYEYSMITQELYVNQDNDKFIPILREGNFDECSPKFLKSYIYFDMTNDSKFDQDFNKLVRIIYDEPEIKRPANGRKPIFAQKSIERVSFELIDDKLNMQKTRMTTFAKWSIDIQLASLSDIKKPALFNLISNNLIIDKETKNVLPNILINSYKVSHHPDVLYKFPLSRTIAYNHIIEEALMLDDSFIHYEFSEYGDYDFWFLYISQPFSTLFYLLVIINNIHKQLGKSTHGTILLKFLSDKRALLYSKHSPFNYPKIFDLQAMSIPNSKAEIAVEFNALTKDSIFNLFQQVYSLFVSENPTSKWPFAYLDKEHFYMVTSDYLSD